jgi:hypothetical protein
MPRRPTRSRSNNPTRKDINRRLEDLTEEEYGDIKTITLAEVLSCELETVDEERGIVRVKETGKLKRYGSSDSDRNLADLPGVGDE